MTCSGLCREGYFCPAGSTTDTQHPCGDSSLYCPVGSARPVSVSSGYHSVGGGGPSTRAAQEICSEGYFCSKKFGVKFPCPPGTYGSRSGLEGEVGVTHCSGLCEPGHFCPYNSTSSRQVPCPPGTYGRDYGLKDEACTAPCPVGHYCPEGAVEPVKCPPGVFGGYEGLKDASCVLDCEGGLCSDSAISAGLCAEGFYCPEGAVTPVASECGGSGAF